MGMFDTITFEYDLPTGNHAVLAEYNLKTFQTKDFDSVMDHYIVDKEGLLFLERNEYEIKGKDELGFDKFKLTNSYREKLNTTTTINCYNSFADKTLNLDYWVEYCIIFIDGKLSSANLVEFKATDNTEHKKAIAKLLRDSRELKEFRNTVYGKWFYRPYAIFVQYLFNLIRKLTESIQSNGYKIERKLLFRGRYYKKRKLRSLL